MSTEQVKARDLVEGQAIDMADVIRRFESDADPADQIVAESEYALVESVEIEASKVPGVKEIAVIYTDQHNIAVDADALIEVSISDT